MKIFTFDQIKAVAGTMDFSRSIEDGFMAYTRGEVVVPPVGELSFEAPPGDTHIKYGYIRNDEVFVIKIASGFYDNPRLGLPSNTGLMLIFSQKTGMLQAILLDEGFLTDIRTAVAGQIAARYLAPERVEGIGVFGTGIQARMQVEFLRSVTDCRRVVAWGRSREHLDRYAGDMAAVGFAVETTRDAAEVAGKCNLIVTCTPSREPLLTADMVRPGTHITAMGADTSFKQELDGAILGGADVVVADSISQCMERGEIFKAIESGAVTADDVVELGAVIARGVKARTGDDQITVADLTGVAVQDIQIAKAVFAALDDQ